MNRHAYLTKKKDEIVELAKANPKFDVNVLDTIQDTTAIMICDDERKKHFLFASYGKELLFSFDFNSDEYRYNSEGQFPFEIHTQQWWDKMYTAIPITSRTFYRELKHFITLLS